MTSGSGRARLTWKWRVIAGLVIGLVNAGRWRVTVQGLEHVPRDGGAVLAFNHHSYLDFVMVAWAPVRQLKRPVRFLAKREIWASRWLGWMVRWAEAVPVDRGSSQARAGAFDAAASALRNGDLVAVAPEQTISPSFDLLPLRTGAVRMAQLSGAPLVPAIGWGSQRVATKGRRPRVAPGTPIVIRYGEPLFVGPDEDPVAATERLREAMADLLDVLQKEYVDGAPAGAWWVPARLGGSAPSHDEVLRTHQRRWRGQAGS
ncbi:MAG TPA: lysophospholipid acyltransferase family protein [Egicoccus sp.]|nr:lysophospholipid acyltransferase family protein [Egicoccus sp.]HSK22071.1 lysophospholipid acyltransferase family protein [Egicoccus sp.]